MTWPPDLELRWQVFLTGIENAIRGFYLLTYDALAMRTAVLQRLQQDFAQKGWRLSESILSPLQVIQTTAQAEQLNGYKAIVVDLDQANYQNLRSLNLGREALYALPTNIIFLASQETHARLAMDAPDLASWFSLPYRFTMAPETGKLAELHAQRVVLSPEIHRRLRQTLLRCGPFDHDRNLRVVFIDARLSVWREGLPEALSRAERVDAVIAYLLDRYNRDGENALILFLRVLSEQFWQADACHQQLGELAEELSRQACTTGDAPL